MVTFDKKTMEQFRQTLEDAEKEQVKVQNRLEELKSNIKALSVLLGEKKYAGRPMGEGRGSFVNKVHKVLQDNSKEALTANDVAKILTNQGVECNSSNVVSVLWGISKKEKNQVERVSLGCYKFTG
jgi:DNA repair exonuclease SbcCD ATPase subunit